MGETACCQAWAPFTLLQRHSHIPAVLPSVAPGSTRIPQTPAKTKGTEQLLHTSLLPVCHSWCYGGGSGGGAAADAWRCVVFSCCVFVMLLS